LNTRQKIVVSIFIIGPIVLWCGWLYYSGFFFVTGITPCSPPPNMSVDGMIRGKAYAFLDKNQNGKPDEEEEPLPNVKIAYPYELRQPITDAEGFASVGRFKPGCECKCWNDEYIEVEAIKGYCNTTPLKLDMTGDDQTYYFGFIEGVECQ
jgi:hypothetical protein